MPSSLRERQPPKQLHLPTSVLCYTDVRSSLTTSGHMRMGPRTTHPPPFFRWEENGKAGSPESTEKKEPCVRTQFHGIPCALAGCKASHAGSFLRSIVRSGQRRVVFQKKPAPSPDLVHENETPMKLIALRYYRMGILCLQRFCGEMGSSRNNITLQGFG